MITARTFTREAGGKTERMVMTTVSLPSADVEALTRPIAAQLEADGYVPEEES